MNPSTKSLYLIHSYSRILLFIIIASRLEFPSHLIIHLFINARFSHSQSWHKDTKVSPCKWLILVNNLIGMECNFKNHTRCYFCNCPFIRTNIQEAKLGWFSHSLINERYDFFQLPFCHYPLICLLNWSLYHDSHISLFFFFFFCMLFCEIAQWNQNNSRLQNSVLINFRRQKNRSTRTSIGVNWNSQTFFLS